MDPAPWSKHMTPQTTAARAAAAHFEALPTTKLLAVEPFRLTRTELRAYAIETLGRLNGCAPHSQSGSPLSSR